MNWSASLCSSAKRIQKELAEVNSEAPRGCWAGPKGERLFDWVAVLMGPRGTPYEGGTFFLDVHFPQDYPFNPPKIRFQTRVYHCNVNSFTGDIQLEILDDSWSPAMTISRILQEITALLHKPCLDEAIMLSIAQLYLQDTAAHDEKAAEWTERFAR